VVLGKYTSGFVKDIVVVDRWPFVGGILGISGIVALSLLIKT
jgi:hypothetical protein